MFHANENTIQDISRITDVDVIGALKSVASRHEQLCGLRQSVACFGEPRLPFGAQCLWESLEYRLLGFEEAAERVFELFRVS